MCRDVAFHFDPDMINRYYDYNLYVMGQVDDLHIIRDLYQLGAEWVIKPGEAIKFKVSDLSVTYMVRHSLICTKLLPAAHPSDVTKEKIILLYAIASRRLVDIEEAIHQSTTGGLGNA